MLTPGNNERKIAVGGLPRAYRAYLPERCCQANPLAVVMMFHGGGTNPNWLSRFCGMEEKAEDAGFVLVFPYGTGVKSRRLTWNCGERCGFERWAPDKATGGETPAPVDDVAFVSALLDDLSRQVKVDPARVYASGISTGALMCYYVASHLAERIAAIAPVGGPMGEATCHPSRPVPIIHFHGTEDEFAPYGGGPGPKSYTGVDFFSVEYTMRMWTRANRCLPEPQVTDLPVLAGDGTSVSLNHWVAKPGGAEIKLYTIHGGGHTWPGRDPRMDLMGRSTNDINANDLIWDFFQQHPIPDRS